MASIPPFYEGGGQQLDKSAYKAVAVTPDNATNFAFKARALYVGTTGDVVVVNPDFTTCTFTAVPAGAIIPCECVRVNSTNTTASNIVALL